jgi:crotonobetainyl-CoA:carnitine CoA-transferase CaiB-like acyl-CoA transferase
MSTAPLSHLRVLDLTDLRGALAGRLLADLGADIIKVEPPGGDPGRLQPPFVGGIAAPDRSLPFLYRNANKRGVVIDLRDPAGRRRFAELCGHTDILLENLGREGQRRLGLSPAEVRAHHPRLIHVAMADFGLSGPRADWRLEPLPAFAASGALHAAGFLDLPPCWLPGYVAHDCASVFGAAGALIAILDRARHGEGQTIEVSVQEAALNGLNPWSIPLADYARLYPIVPPAPPRNADGLYLVLPTADGYVRVLPGTPRHWRAFVTLMGSPEALAGPEWEFSLYRLLNGDVIRLLATDSLRERSRAEVFAEAQRLGLPLAPVNTPDEFVAEEQTRRRGYFQQTGFPQLGDAPFAPAPLNFSVTPAVLRHPAPAPGQDDRAGFSARTPEPVSGAADAPLLAGKRVIDLGVGAVGPELCWVLAELGAEVIKIESRQNLDFLRAVTVEPDQPNRAWTFNTEARGQKSVCLNLRTPRGRELGLQLCATADVIVENNRGGVVRHWGLDYDDVRRVRPDIVYIASQGFGRGGPLGEAASFGPLNSSFAGTNWLWNHAAAPYPAGCALNHPDHIASKLGAVAVLAALEHRRRTGQGQFIEMAQTEAAAYFLGEFYLQGPCTGHAPQQQGNASEYAVPHGVYPCAGEDRWCAIAVVDDATWPRFVACVGWPSEDRFTTIQGRLAARAEIDGRVAQWTGGRTPEDAAAALQAAGVSAMPVQNPDDHRADPHLAARGAIVTVEHAEIGPERHIGNPLRMSRSQLITAGAAPLLDADTKDILTHVLGLQEAEVDKLIADGVCG